MYIYCKPATAAFQSKVKQLSSNQSCNIYYIIKCITHVNRAKKLPRKTYHS